MKLNVLSKKKRNNSNNKIWEMSKMSKMQEMFNKLKWNRNPKINWDHMKLLKHSNKMIIIEENLAKKIEITTITTKMINNNNKKIKIIKMK